MYAVQLKPLLLQHVTSCSTFSMYSSIILPLEIPMAISWYTHNIVPVCIVVNVSVAVSHFFTDSKIVEASVE